MVALPDTPLTPDDYLIMEKDAAVKSEYYNGQLIAMVGATLNNNRITGNLFNLISNGLDNDDCEVFISDLRVWIETRQTFTYPDVIVLCESPALYKNRTDTITNPSILIEVLSKSTESKDRSDKFHSYWTLPSLQEYILVDQYKPHIEAFRRTGEQLWELRVFTTLNEALTFNALKLSLPMRQIYRNVVWNTEQ